MAPPESGALYPFLGLGFIPRQEGYGAFGRTEDAVRGVSHSPCPSSLREVGWGGGWEASCVREALGKHPRPKRGTGRQHPSEHSELCRSRSSADPCPGRSGAPGGRQLAGRQEAKAASPAAGGGERAGGQSRARGSVGGAGCETPGYSPLQPCRQRRRRPLRPGRARAAPGLLRSSCCPAGAERRHAHGGGGGGGRRTAPRTGPLGAAGLGWAGSLPVRGRSASRGAPQLVESARPPRGSCGPAGLRALATEDWTPPPTPVLLLLLLLMMIPPVAPTYSPPPLPGIAQRRKEVWEQIWGCGLRIRSGAGLKPLLSPSVGWEP
ncbi:uncharacterized protein LOC131185865 [Ahaetulla prasina]|uniref:uncharacterized protein LOC131185865 n=1 Tax=Ahaetulla prasina TaxID=499056 RepID=UPI002648CD79|nr:uncharacterized protein LOC131185865 [Ahaetulla prasina]